MQLARLSRSGGGTIQVTKAGPVLLAAILAITSYLVLCSAQGRGISVRQLLPQASEAGRAESFPVIQLLPAEDLRKPECPVRNAFCWLRSRQDLLESSFGDTLPDLTVLTTWVVPDSICPSDTVDIHSVIKNIGIVDVQDSFYFDMWFDGDNIGYGRLDGLPAGETRELVRDAFVWPPDGYTHAVTAMADTDHEIAETDTTNNIHLEWFTADWCGMCQPVSIPFGAGWNWFSLNVSDLDMSLDNVLSSLDTNAVYIKNQVSFAEYVPALGGWFGTLSSLSCLDTYLIRLAFPDTLEFCGIPFDATTVIPVNVGWNWISYLPQAGMEVDPALASLDTNGIYIKNQVSFAEYVPALGGWLGTLEQMTPLDGYKLRMADADDLVYPGGASLALGVSENDRLKWYSNQGYPAWAVRPGDYELTGSVTASVWVDGESASHEGLLAAFAGGECRGVQRASEKPGGGHLFYLTVYGRAEGEHLTFKYYDCGQDVLCEMAESVRFCADMTLGRSFSPVKLTALPGTKQRTDEGKPPGTVIHGSCPSPFSETTAIAFSMPKCCRVRIEIFNVEGERIITLADEDFGAGRHRVIWDGRDHCGSPVVNGIYFYRFEAGGCVLVYKMALLR
jgi:hypothetical protein